MKKRHLDDDLAGGPASTATREDLALAVADLAESERLRSRAVARLARVRARGDGEAAVGMPITQHLRWRTNVRRGTVTTIGVVTDVAGEMPSLVAALEAGQITLDQAGAVAWPAARVSGVLRGQLDVSLATDPGWTGWSPEVLEAEVARLLEDLTPAVTEARELELAQRQFLHLQSTLDGQGLKFWGQAWGVDAATIDASLRAAADPPAATGPDPDGVLAGKPTERDGQLFTGLLRLCRRQVGKDGTTAGPDVTIYAVVDETAEGSGSGELITERRGLAPRLSAAAVRRLQDEGARRVEVFAVDREIVAVKGRAGHALDDPDALSEDTSRIIVTVRDRACRMAGCDRPVEHLHHLVWRAAARARGEIAPDDPGHLAGLCQRCHQLVHDWRWSGTVGAVGRITFRRAGVTITTLGRLAQRLPRPPPPRAGTHDQFGDPLPF